MPNSLFEEVRELATRRHIPLVCHFDLTYRCNLRCVHCYITEQRASELAFREVRNILIQLAKAGTLYLTLSGGEVLTRRDALEIVGYARRLHFAVRLLTNGTLINAGMADKIAALSPEKVAISVYGANPEVHDQVTRQAGSFQKSLTAARMLRERGVRVKLATVIMRQNLHEYHLVSDLAKNLGADFQADYRIAPKNDGDPSPLQFHIDAGSIRQVLSDPVFFRDAPDSAEEHYSGVFDQVPCGASHTAVYISPYGEVYPCVQLPIGCGSLREKSFEQIWKASAAMNRVRSVRISDLTKCSGCAMLPYCRPCIGLSFLEEGDLLAPARRACQEAAILREQGRSRR